jgi:hypothetical protein
MGVRRIGAELKVLLARAWGTLVAAESSFRSLDGRIAHLDSHGTALPVAMQ